MIRRNFCAICSSKLEHLYKLSGMPIKLTCTEKPEIKLSDMSFSQCVHCKTIQLDKLVPLEVLYSQSHNYVSVGKVWEGYFELFCDIITPLIRGKTVLEIGDPSGKIANRVDGFRKWLIVEPNKNFSVTFKPNVEFLEEFFDSSFKIEEEIDLITHSHLFEHIYEPGLFLKKCYEILKPGGEMFFGVPNMEHISAKGLCPFLGIFFEHTIFLDKENITFLLESNGFKVVEIYDYLAHSVLYRVRKDVYSDCNHVIIKDHKNLFFESLSDYKNFANQVSNGDRPVYLFGASYNTQFLLSLGIDSRKISGILDNCKEKQGKYLYGYDIEIKSPNVVKNTDSMVILKNGYYLEEIREQLLKINPNTIILS